MDKTNYHLHDYWAIIKHNKSYFLAPFVVILFGAIIVAYVLPPVYESSATFIIENNPLNDTFLRTGSNEGAEVFIENITQQIMNRQSLKELIQHNKLYGDTGAKVDELTWDKRIKRMRNDLELEKITTDVMNPRPGIATVGFTVTYKGHDPDKVYTVAREISSRYLAKQIEDRSQKAQMAVVMIQTQLQDIEKKMLAQEERIRAYQNQHAGSLPEKTSLNRDMAVRLDAEANRIEADIQRIRQQKTNLETNLNPDLQTLKKMKAELAAKEATLSPKHPDIAILRNAIQKLEGDLASGKGKTGDPAFRAQMDAANTELARLQNKLTETKAQRDAYRARLESNLQGTGEYRLLVSDYESLRQQQQKISAQLAAARAAEEAQTDQSTQSLRLVEVPVYPEKPQATGLIISLIGFGLAVGVGFMTVIVKSLLVPVIWSDGALAELTQAPVLAVIPKIDPKILAGNGHRAGPFQVPQIQYTRTKIMDTSENTLKQNKLLTYFSGNVVADHFGVLKVKIRERMKKGGMNTILVTSAVAGEGKSLTATNLTLSLAKEIASTVVLVDADLRNPSLHTFFGLDPAQGVSDYLFHDHPLEDIFINPGINKLLLLPGHARVEDSAEVLGAPKMERLIKELKARYPDRYVIIDAPPLNGLADSLILSQYADGVILVVEAGKTTRSQILNALGHLEGSTLIGLVLNKGDAVV